MIAGLRLCAGPTMSPTEAEMTVRRVWPKQPMSRLREIHANYGIVESPSTPEEFERRYRDDGPLWMSIVRELGVTLD
jgi:hypothetical protein